MAWDGLRLTGGGGERGLGPLGPGTGTVESSHFPHWFLPCFRILLENLASCSVFSVPTDYRNDTQTLVPNGGLKLFWDEVLMS